MTVEQALNGLHKIYSAYPNTALAAKAHALTEEIVSRQVDYVLPVQVGDEALVTIQEAEELERKIVDIKITSKSPLL